MSTVKHVLYARTNLSKALDSVDNGNEEAVVRFIKRALAEIRQIKPKDV